MSPRYRHRLHWFLFFPGACLLAVAAFSYFSPPSGPALEDLQTNVEVPDCTVGEKREVTLRLHNSSGRPLRVLGLALC